MKTRVVVLGGGVIGLCTAWYCRQRGLEVTLVELGSAERTGCSFCNAGMIVPSHVVPLAAPGVIRQGLKWLWDRDSPFAVRPRLSADLMRWGLEFWKASTPARVNAAAPLLGRLHLASRQLFEQLADEPGMDFSLVRRGLLMLSRTRQGFEADARLADRTRQLGIPAEMLDAGQVKNLEPNVDLAVHGAVFFPEDCHLVPERFMADLQRELDKQGVRFLWNTPATGWRVDGRQLRALETGQSTVEGDQFVLCGGVWSSGLARGLRLRLPLQAGKGYTLTLSRPRQLPTYCALLGEARVAVTPMTGSLRVGGTMELAASDPQPKPRRIRGIIQSFCSTYPSFQPEDFSEAQVWTGLRPVSPDGLPYLGRTRHLTNLFVAAGHGMMGLSLGPITGQIIADLIADEPCSFDLGLFDVDRFA
jgi:D-amino-acid dehydrogenase